MRIVRRLGWNLILLLIAATAYGVLDVAKPTLASFCKPASQHTLPEFRVMRGDLWSNVASHDFDLRLIRTPTDEISVYYDWTAALCPSSFIPLRIHLVNRSPGQWVQFGVEIFVEAPTGIIIGSFGLEGDLLKLGYNKDFNDIMAYNVPAEWQGYDLRIHPIVWEFSRENIYYYQPFLAWTLPSVATIFLSGQSSVRFFFYLITSALLLPVIAPEGLKQSLDRRWTNTSRLWKLIGSAVMFISYMFFWAVIVAFQYAHP
jgi:hypothetical protein